MREGFTTGSCAAAAALASCIWRRDGHCPERVEIIVPEGRSYMPEIIPGKNYCCGVQKDGGDDPDITHGHIVWAKVDVRENSGEILFSAGDGVGVITLPGLKLPVGEAAINPVPRQMIAEAIRSVYPCEGAKVTVSVEGGTEIAKKTFNPRLGIEGGISILGTSGIVRPMSEDALKATIALEISMRHAQNPAELMLTFGNQGEQDLKALYPSRQAAQMSNFVGFALDEAAKLGFRRILIGGHPGKLAKVSAGVMQTHSRYGDARREALITQLALMDAPAKLLLEIWNCTTMDGAIQLLAASNFNHIWNVMADAAQDYCEARVHGELEIDIVFTDGKGNCIGQSKRLRKDENRWKTS